MSMWISIQRMPFYILYRDIFISIIKRHTFYRYPHTISTCFIDIHVIYPHAHIHECVHILYPHTHIHEYVDIYRTYDVLYFLHLQISTYYIHIPPYISMSTYYIHIPIYMSTWISIERMTFYILYREIFISIIERQHVLQISTIYIHMLYRYPHTTSTYPHTWVCPHTISTYQYTWVRGYL